MAGKVSTSEMAKVQFSLPKLHDNQVIEWNVHVSKTLNSYNMIIGRDILSKLRIDIHFSTLTCTWDSRTIPMRESSVLPEQSYLVEETGPVAESTSRLKKILDAKYEKANLPEIVESSIHLKDDQKIKLKKLLTKYESLFDGTLGQW